MTNLIGEKLTPGANVKVYRIANLDDPDRMALLAALDALANKDTDVADWLSALPLLEQAALVNDVREGKAAAYFAAYDAYRVKHEQQPMNKFQRMCFIQTLIDHAWSYIKQSGKFSPAEFNEIVAQLFSLNETSDEVTQSDLDDLLIPF